jgi:large repetitive protein
LERYGNFSYSVPLPNGNYTVLLRFAELYHSSPGKRIFDVYIQGTKVISNLDIFALVGKNAAYDVSFPATVADGTLDIRFSTIADNAKVNAVLVRTR